MVQYVLDMGACKSEALRLKRVSGNPYLATVPVRWSAGTVRSSSCEPVRIRPVAAFHGARQPANLYAGGLFVATVPAQGHGPDGLLWVCAAARRRCSRAVFEDGVRPGRRAEGRHRGGHRLHRGACRHRGAGRRFRKEWRLPGVFGNARQQEPIQGPVASMYVAFHTGVRRDLTVGHAGEVSDR